MNHGRRSRSRHNNVSAFDEAWIRSQKGKMNLKVILWKKKKCKKSIFTIQWRHFKLCMHTKCFSTSNSGGHYFAETIKPIQFTFTCVSWIVLSMKHGDNCMTVYNEFMPSNLKLPLKLELEIERMQTKKKCVKMVYFNEITATKCSNNADLAN